MLTRAGFCNNTLFTKALTQQRLAYGVIDFVRAGMIQVFAFQINTALEFLAQAAGKKQGAWTTDKVA